MTDLAQQMAAARACTLCAPALPLGPRPVFRASATARLLIASQAPGTRVHETGIPFNDPSGVRLRDWLGLTPEEFYDEARIALLPMGFCYPGRLPRGGDAPPRRECAPYWRPRLLPHLTGLRLTLLVGSYAIAHTLGPGPVAPRVRDFQRYLPRHFPLPHPSWRTLAWQRRHPWFDAEVLPALRAAVRAAIEAA